MLCGFCELEGAVKVKNVTFAMTYGDELVIVIDVLVKKIGVKMIVCDFLLFCDGLKWWKELVVLCEARSAYCEECDAYNVVSCWEVSDKFEVGVWMF